MKKLAGKVALVTGASRGLGRATAIALAAEGALVAVHYGRNEGAAREVIAEIEKNGGEAFSVRADLSRVGEVEQLFASLDAELKKRRGDAKFDILVNNAGVAERAPFEETDEKLFDHHFDLNVKGLFFTSQKALPRIRDNGRIVNISSVVARQAFDGISAYAATKGAVNTFTLYLAQVAGKRGITVNAVSPGAIDTDMNAAWLAQPGAAEQIKGGQILKRIGQSEDIAGAVLALTLPESGWITAQIVEASGGTRIAG